MNEYILTLVLIVVWIKRLSHLKKGWLPLIDNRMKKFSWMGGVGVRVEHWNYKFLNIYSQTSCLNKSLVLKWFYGLERKKLIEYGKIISVNWLLCNRFFEINTGTDRHDLKKSSDLVFMKATYDLVLWDYFCLLCTI